MIPRSLGSILNSLQQPQCTEHSTYTHMHTHTHTHTHICCSVTQLCPTLCDPMDYSTSGFPVLHYLPEFAQIYVHWIGDAIQPPHPLSSPSPPASNLSHHRGIFKWINSSHQVAKILELHTHTHDLEKPIFLLIHIAEMRDLGIREDLD